jgi:hypothetical protein
MMSAIDGEYDYLKYFKKICASYSGEGEDFILLGCNAFGSLG